MSLCRQKQKQLAKAVPDIRVQEMAHYSDPTPQIQKRTMEKQTPHSSAQSGRYADNEIQ